MKIVQFFIILYCIPLFFVSSVISYNLPAVNLGLTNILDGGPLLVEPGWYWREYFHHYHADKFTNAKGGLLGGVPSPHFSYTSISTQFVYLSEKKLLDGYLGFDVTLPWVVSARIQRNNLKLISSGGGLADFLLGGFIQWETIMHKGEPLFVHRLNLGVSFPSGKNRLLCKTINPGNKVYALRPFWAGTFYFSRDWAISWRLHYLWSSTNKITHIQAGQAIHMNYDIEYAIRPNLWIAFTGYFLKQLNDSTLCGVNIPNSRERVLGSGIGALYITNREYYLLSYLYFESLAQNRTQGVRFVFRLIKYF